MLLGRSSIIKHVDAAKFSQGERRAATDFGLGSPGFPLPLISI